MSRVSRVNQNFSACQENQKNQRLSYEESLTICLKPVNCFTAIKEELVCVVCENCVWMPRRCSSCRVYVCSNCIYPMNTNNNNKCPCCKEKFQSKPIHKSVWNYLSQLKFSCSDCKNTFNFNDALNHMKYCRNFLLKVL